jgi:hypothetical protein
LLGNGLLTHGCCGVDARLHDNECVRKPESWNNPFPDRRLVSVPVTTDTQIIINETFKGVFRFRSAPSYKRKFIRQGGGVEYPTVTLRVVGVDEKGSYDSETVKYGHESHGTRTRKGLRWRGPGAIVNDRLVLLSQRTPHINKPAIV